MTATTIQILARRIILPLDPDGCWEWHGSHAGPGYANAYINGRMQYVHRLTYTLFCGEIGAGLEIDHLCRNRGCVNPNHLEPVTHRENGLRGNGAAARAARQTHCKHGHEFTPENTYRHSGHGRRCKTCTAATLRRRRTRRNDKVDAAVQERAGRLVPETTDAS